MGRGEPSGGRDGRNGRNRLRALEEEVRNTVIWKKREKPNLSFGRRDSEYRNMEETEETDSELRKKRLGTRMFILAGVRDIFLKKKNSRQFSHRIPTLPNLRRMLSSLLNLMTSDDRSILIGNIRCVTTFYPGAQAFSTGIRVLRNRIITSRWKIRVTKLRNRIITSIWKRLITIISGHFFEEKNPRNFSTSRNLIRRESVTKA
jgi:hypothetical protein